jgi:putative CocE/NonD family hydrolase
MGDNEWEDHDVWPPADVEYRPMYFHEGSGLTEESLNCGAMSFDVPWDSEQPDAYDYDPMDPVPGGPPATDMRGIEGRLLTYTSSALEVDLKVVGPLNVVLHASSSARDTDWFVRLCDVWPDGRSIQIQRGQLRARYRNSFEVPELMEPGEVYEFEIDLAATANVFKVGHKLRVQVTSSEYPKFGRTLNTGGVNAEETEGVVAHNTIFHDAARFSHILLPVIG